MVICSRKEPGVKNFFCVNKYKTGVDIHPNGNYPSINDGKKK
jgi:hypothetical protein